MQNNGELQSFQMVQSSIQIRNNKYLPTLHQEQKSFMMGHQPVYDK